MGERAQSPLTGKRVVITRAITQSEGLFDALRAREAEPLLFPLIRIVPLQEYEPLDAALARLRAGDWIILTSQNAVAPVAGRGRMLRKEFFSAAEGVKVAVVGPASERAALDANLRVDYVANVQDGVSLAHELGERLRGRRVLLPRSDLASPALPAAVQKFGAEVIEVAAYHTERVREWDRRLGDTILHGAVDAVVCFSPSAVHALTDFLSTNGARADFQNTVAFVAVGAVTAQAFRDEGIHQPLVAAEATNEAAINVLSEYFAGRRQPHFAGAKKS